MQASPAREAFAKRHHRPHNNDMSGAAADCGRYRTLRTTAIRWVFDTVGRRLDHAGLGALTPKTNVHGGGDKTAASLDRCNSGLTAAFARRRRFQCVQSVG